MATEDDRVDTPLVALYEGTVTNVADPLRVGRVRLRVPGIIDGESGWALPLGPPGGGEARRGLFAVPPVGAEVGVWFVQGDVDRPRYVPGHWGAPGGASQSPTPVQEVAVEDAHHITCLETQRYLLTFDNREGVESVELRDKVSGDGITMHGAQGAIEIKGTTAVRIHALGAVSITGLAVSIQGRTVLPGSKPI